MRISRIGGLGRYLEQEGVGAALLQLLKFFAGFFFRKEKAFLLSFPLEHFSPAAPQNVPFAIEHLRPEQIHQLTAVVFYSQREILRRLAENQECFIAEIKGKIVHYSWLTSITQYAWEVEKAIPLGTGEYYLYNCRTLQAFRGGGIFKAVIACAAEEVKEKRGRKLLALVEAANQSSLRAFQAVGFQIQEEIELVRFLWMKRHRIKPYASDITTNRSNP